MATKRLSRTVIEGGRRGFNTWERRFSSKEERAQTRQYMSKIITDPESFEDECEPERDPVWKEFSDKLNPMYRWLDAQVGRPWSEVRSEVFKNFDTRTTAGRHITFDHLLREVVDTESGFDSYGHMVNPDIPVISNEKNKYRYYGYRYYYVDDNDILRKNPSYTRRRRLFREPYPTQQEVDEVSKWLDGRIIGFKDGKYCWFAPTQGIWKAEWLKSEYGYSFELKYYVEENGEFSYKTKRSYTFAPGFWFETIKSHGNHWKEIDIPFSFRQRCELSSDEVKYFNSLNPRIRRQILEFGKGR